MANKYCIVLYVDIISGVHGRGENMSVLLLEPAGRESSAQT